MRHPLRVATAPDGGIAATARPGPPAIAGPGATVTLKDVAARANVHPATASRALHPSTRHLVRPGTARRVIRAAVALGYVANHAAASLRTRSTRTVGVLLPDLADPLAAAFARGLEDQLGTAGYVALTGSTDRDPARERMLLMVMRGRHVDGLILAGDAVRAPLATAAAQTGLPVVVAGCCRALAEGGFACPHDISVTGRGNLSPAGSMPPPLTTIRLPQYRMGAQVAQLLLDRIATPSAPPVARPLPPELIVRAATALCSCCAAGVP